jgi:DNA-binding CsgD family transcriptional regulator
VEAFRNPPCQGRLHGREVELAAVVDEAESLVFVEGHAGIGKTSLLEAARSRLGTAGVRVLWASGQELEGEFAFGVVRQLFERVLLDASPDERRRLLAGPAALASVAVGVESARGAGGGSADSPFPVMHGLYWLTANLADRGRLALFVDDAHWADALSLRFVDFLAARLEGLSVEVVVAARPPGAGYREAGLLERLRERAGSGLLRLGPLGLEPAGALVRERFGPEVSQGLIAACVEATAGNPFFLGELVDALVADRVAPEAAAELVSSLGPGTVARSVMLRVGSLPAAAARVAEAVAVLEAQAEPRRVAELTGMSVEEVGMAADALEAANVLDGKRPLRFVHPIVRQAIYGGLQSRMRARLHARAAEVLMEEQGPPEAAAAHVLLSEPRGDRAAVELLRRAAGVALSRGGAGLARRLLERALAEPPSHDQLGEVLGELGVAEVLAGGELSSAAEHLERAAALTGDRGLRCERVSLAARTRSYGGDFAGAAALLERERAEVSAEDGHEALRLLADEAGIGVLSPPAAPGALAALEQHAGRSGERPEELALLAELAGKRWLEGRVGEAIEFARRALAGGRLLAHQGSLSWAFNHAVAVLIDGDQLEQAAGPLQAGLAVAREQGSLPGVATLTGLQAIIAWRRGMVLETEALSREMLELSAASGTSVPDPHFRAYLGAALVEAGRLDEAEEAIVGCGVGPGLPNLTFGGMPFVARARLRLAQGHPDEALQDLLELRSREQALEVRHMRFAWRREAVQASLALGDAELAAELAGEQLELTSRWDIPSARGIALCTQGLAAGGGEGLELLAQGAALLAGSPARLDHARALADLGGALRREGRRVQARQPLTAATEQARICGATALAEHARAELVAAGARPRRQRFTGVESLTAAEWRVAGLAVQGHSNREIAAARFITVRTVENHLASCYRKLGIRSRRELARALEAHHD